MGFGWERGGVGGTWEPPRARVSRTGIWPEWGEEVREPGTGCVFRAFGLGVGGMKGACMRTRDEKRASGGPRRKMCALPSKDETLGSPACVAVDCRVGCREWKHGQGRDLL